MYRKGVIRPECLRTTGLHMTPSKMFNLNLIVWRKTNNDNYKRDKSRLWEFLQNSCSGLLKSVNVLKDKKRWEDLFRLKEWKKT